MWRAHEERTLTTIKMGLIRIFLMKNASLLIFAIGWLQLAFLPLGQAQESNTTSTPTAEAVSSFSITTQKSQKILIKGHPITLILQAQNDKEEVVSTFDGQVEIAGVNQNGNALSVVGPFENGKLTLENVTLPSGQAQVSLEGSEAKGTFSRNQIPAILTLLPAILAILLSLWTRQVLISLFCGLWVGVMMIQGWNPFTSFFTSVDTYLIGALANADHAHILFFSLSLAGMVGVIHFNGGIHGIVQMISRFARTARSGQASTCFLGCLIFFDDYANSLIVGNTMRSFTDRLRISREKLAFLVDSTAAPVATIGVISTWTAYQTGLLEDVLPSLEPGKQAYLYFLGSIPYAFYSLLMLMFVYMVSFSLRDFGSMRKAEERTIMTGQVLRDGAEPLTDTQGHAHMNPTAKGIQAHWWMAALPIAVLIFGTLAGLFITGFQSTGGEASSIREIIGASDSYKALLWSAVGASLLAMVLSVAKGHKPTQVLNSWLDGANSLRLAVIILLLAWSISALCKDLGTGQAIASLVPDAISAKWIPAITFVTAGLIAFSTGTSYGTMGILVPILLPLCYELGRRANLDPGHVSALGSATLAAILGGAVFGDHCSPISDTTVLSSMAAGSDHIDHVRTQMPYAITVGAITIPSYILVGYGFKLIVIFPIAIAVLGLILLLLSSRRSSNPVLDNSDEIGSTVYLSSSKEE